ncbi:Slp family lipoprotein [Ningiella sp. W23]|uniref:Slp family lipoprotein n=1 Tax=Ningiella sp. W23 TaxID=3023715 RepID=UPI003758085A
MKKLLTLIGLISSLGACTMVPDPIRVQDELALVPFDQIINNPVTDLASGENARWGGKIVGVQNLESVSEIEVVYFPESSNGKPQTSEQSAGRFKAVVEGFIDPLVFEQDRLITFVGQVGSPVDGIIGEQKYSYPTLNADGYYMWRDTTEVDVRQTGFNNMVWFGGARPGLWDPWFIGPRYGFYDPWLAHRRHLHHSRYRVVQTNAKAQGGQLRPPTRTNSRNITRPSPNISEPRSPRVKQLRAEH